MTHGHWIAPPLSESALQARRARVIAIAQMLGFVGKVEYCHAYSDGTGGAQYGQASAENHDLLIVYAKAFDRDADPEDFSLEATIAHETGHQILARHPRIAKRVAGISRESEEILALLIGAIICSVERDRRALYMKAAGELAERRHSPESIERQLLTLWELLEAML
jgi:hypothetical protein